MTSDNLEISYVWKPLVASCVCVAEVRTRVFSVFVSSVKCARLLCQRCSPPGRNTFVVSDKRVSLQCDIVFEGE